MNDFFLCFCWNSIRKKITIRFYISNKNIRCVTKEKMWWYFYFYKSTSLGSYMWNLIQYHQTSEIIVNITLNVFNCFFINSILQYSTCILVLNTARIDFNMGFKRGKRTPRNVPKIPWKLPTTGKKLSIFRKFWDTLLGKNFNKKRKTEDKNIFTSY